MLEQIRENSKPGLIPEGFKEFYLYYLRKLAIKKGKAE
ncbi:hypothetical protein MmTuc01_0669 [Methanosarcina mazei Tuc01]|uniref:Uncharacterized protein n=1 Tax=Methanosarcina mazei Tuc01 TaxID=1236903 RepID=M1P6Q0_METMZ|nr:hypothetical protein MmTuc01_0669 [Methanosarcina mazei Tuc01]